MTHDNYKQAVALLEDAITQACTLTECHDEGDFVAGWVLIVNGVRYMSPDKDEDFEPGDEDHMVGLSTPFMPLGQSPSLTRGIVEGFRDRLRDGIN